MALGKKTGGRKRGSLNKTSTATTRVLREAVINAAEKVGFDGEGRDGLEGYLRAVAMKDTKAFASLVGRAMPLQVEGGDPHRPVALQIVTGVPRADED